MKHSLNKLLRKGTPFLWSFQCEEAFLLLKEKLTTSPVLRYPDFSKQFHLTTDASNYALGAVLSQIHDNQDCVISFASRSLNPAEKNYSTIEREYLAIVWAINNYRCYLWGRDFIVFSDHKPLLGDSKNPPLRILKWKLKLSEYSFEVRHKPGKQNIIADYLSRVKTQVLLIKTRAQTAKEAEEKIKALADNDQQKKIDNSKNHRPMTDEEISEVINDAQLKPPTKSNYIAGVKVIFDENEKINIVKEAHESLIGGHQGVFRTYSALKHTVRWKNMLRDITKYIKKCKKCQQNKYFRNTNIPLAVTSTSERVFQKVFMDVLGPLRISTSGFSYIVTFQDDLSKYSMAAPMVDQKAETVARTLVDSFISIIGIPETILTDQGSNFMSKLFNNLCKLFKITKINTSAYRAQGNQVEAWHRPLAEYIRNYVGKDPSTWDRFLAPAVFSYNTHVHRTTKKTPFEMVFGRIANIPSSFKKDPIPLYNHDDYVLDLKNRLQQINSEVRKNIVKNKIYSKKNYDKKNTKPFIVKAGDFVWLKNETRDTKFSPLRLGPFEVIDSISKENTSIKIKDKIKIVHNNRLSFNNRDID